METAKNFKWEKKTFQELKEKSVIFEITAQAFKAGDFLNIFLRFLDLWGSFLVVCNQHYRNIHDPSKLVNASKSSILLLF